MMFSKALATLTTSPWRSHLRSSWATTERQCLSQYCDRVLWPPRLTLVLLMLQRALRRHLCQCPHRVSACRAGFKPRALPSEWLLDQGSSLLHLSTGRGHRPREHGVTGDTWSLVPITRSHPGNPGQGASGQCVGSLVWREGDVAMGKLCRP